MLISSQNKTEAQKLVRGKEKSNFAKTTNETVDLQIQFSAFSPELQNKYHNRKCNTETAQICYDYFTLYATLRDQQKTKRRT